MTDYYLDPVNGNDTNDGTTFALRKKTLEAFSGIAGANDVIRVIRNHIDIVDIPGGDITSSVAGDTHIVGNAALGVKELWYGADDIAITTTAYNGTTLYLSSGGPGYGYDISAKIRTAATLLAAANTKYMVFDFGSQVDLSGYTTFVIWVATDQWLASQTSPATIDNDCIRVKLCSDALGDTVLEDYSIPVVAPHSSDIGQWYRLAGTGVGGALPNNVQSIALYSGANYPNHTSGRVGILAAYACTSGNVVAPGDLISPKITGKNRRLWDQVSRIMDGETTSPKIYGTNRAASSGGMYTYPGTQSWELLRYTPWTVRSDFDATASNRMIGWKLDDIASSFTELSIIGGHSDVDGSPGAGYTIVDLGFNNTNAYLIRTQTASNKTISWKNFIGIGGGFNRSPLFTMGSTGQTTQMPVYLENCHVIGGQLLVDTTAQPPKVGSVIKNCSVTAGGDDTYWIGADYTAGVGSILIDGLFVYKQAGNADYYSRVTDVIFRDCWFSGGNTYICEFTRDHNGSGRPYFEGVNEFWYFGDVQIELNYIYPQDQDFGTFKFYGVDLTIFAGGGMVIDGLEFYAGVNGLPASQLTVWGSTNVSANYDGGAIHATSARFTNWIVDTAVDVNLSSGVYENCNIKVSGAISNSASDANASIYRNCTFGSPDDVTTIDYNMYEPPHYYYGCTLHRVRFRNKTNYPSVTMVGGSITGTAHQPLHSTVAASGDYPYNGYLFHNVTFSSGWTPDDLIDTAFHLSEYGLEKGTDPHRQLRFSGWDGDPTKNLIVTPQVEAYTQATTVHTGGGRAWKVRIKYAIREDGIRLPAATVAFRGGVQATVRVWVYATTASTYLYLKAEPEQIGTGQAMIRMASSGAVGSWEELVYQFTPNADGVMEFYITLSGPTDGVIYYDDLSFTQE